MKQELGIDIDGCLNHYHDELRSYIQKLYKIDVPADEYYIIKSLNLSFLKESEFWQHFDEIAIDLKAEIDCKKVIDKLSKLFNINIVTARNYSSATITEQWLNKNKLYYDNIYFHSGSKIDVCNWKNIKIMIEDKPDNAIILAQNGIKVLLFDRLYNQNVKHENVIRCKNWNQIYNTILLMNTKKQ